MTQETSPVCIVSSATRDPSPNPPLGITNYSESLETSLQTRYPWCALLLRYLLLLVCSAYAPTLVTMDEALANWEPHSDENGEFIGPMSDAAGNSLYGQYTDYFTVRSIVYLPPRYAAMVVSRQIPAAQDWLEIGGAIRKDGLTRECADLLTWLRAANCWGRPEDGDPESRIPIVAMTALQYVVPLAGNLATYAARKIALDFPQVQQKLPNVSTNNMTPEHFAAALATALAHKPGRDSKESTVITPKLPSSKFRGLLPLLLKICEVEN